ncbi:nucleolar complex protein 2 homolog isoform X2 [Amborella trichopoda]|uniref:Nucleolar complex protein 2 homolog n=2 Tax=Amborella trichopoda TaxID=13333 RepID=W1PVT5_AMBTC|nr:nucleolar complex protein 2 homolog isoform X2 [Amborella trichopoda]XP_020526573.1 nucleolar complex protein 2 homolog isoform X2 [Amborella trichopoda]ERN11821.1 hypothetical protein AMTR_s00020p00038010 [Amborella trichopoda]|eukprot:XP_020526572.1 nucleolar complex protein 2 homolog isoform X2 [Amborella trichopoda]
MESPQFDEEDMHFMDGEEYLFSSPKLDKSEARKGKTSKKSRSESEEHKKQLERLKEKDPEFYKFLASHDKELLKFSDEDADGDVDETEDAEIDEVSQRPGALAEMAEKPSVKIITTAMVDSWCKVIQEEKGIRPLRMLIQAFRSACHYGDGDDDSSSKLRIMSSSVFNKIMVFVLSEIDGIFRSLFILPSSGGKKETIVELMAQKAWKSYGSLVKSYLGNALHVLNQMTDGQMILFTFKNLRHSAIFLTAFPNLLRKYIKVALHFWSTEEGALSVVSFLFLRDLCIRIGSDCMEPCLKGIYKAYVLNCRFVNATRLPHIHFLGNCVIELYGLDTSSAYQHAFMFIRQLAMILRDALTVKTKEAFRKVYEWKYMNCLELWTRAVSTYKAEHEFGPLAYPLMQIIFGVGRLVPTARYFPLRLQCTRMLNRIAIATGTFLPVSFLLLDMLEFKELNRAPTGGVGNAVDFRTTLKVTKQMVKTRPFQEECVFSVVQELSEHLAQWSYSMAFFELAFIPLARLRCFSKSTRIERFRREVKQLVKQVESNVEFISSRRSNINFFPNDPAAIGPSSEVEEEFGVSPLSKYVDSLRQREQQRKASMVGSSVLVGETGASFSSKEITKLEEEDKGMGKEEGAAVFSSSWLPGGKPQRKSSKPKHLEYEQVQNADEDLVSELELSSDDEEENTPELEPRSASEEPEDKMTPRTKGKKRKPESLISKQKSRKPNAGGRRKKMKKSAR